jgi:acyl-coenzyme A synthetase/AMP-(fatty) acid ligase
VDSAHCHPLVPIGSVGELAIEAPLLARGYLNDPEKTAAAIVSDLDWMASFAKVRKRRAYLTGCLVHCNPDGSIRFTGRKDTRVKVRGFRIELGDVESNIAMDPLVNTVAVFAPSSEACQKRLVGVIVLETKNKPQDSEKLKLIDRSQGNISRIVGDIQNNLSKSMPTTPISWRRSPL